MKSLLSLTFMFVVGAVLSGCACFTGSCQGKSCDKAATAPAEKVAVTPTTAPAVKVPSALGPIHFDLNKAELTPDAKEYLKEAVAAMRANPNLTLTTTSRCDSSGNKARNLQLGDMRVNAVTDYLKSEGVSAARIKGHNNCADGGTERSAQLTLN